MRFLADMALFVEVASVKQFSRAAAALDLPASTLSRRIAALEREMGISLVNRSTRSFALTEAGQVFYERAKRLVSDAKRIREEVGTNASRMSGLVRIGMPVDLAVTIFSPMLAGFVRSNPGMAIDVVTANTFPDLVAEGLDVAFLVSHQTSLPDSSYQARRIGTFGRMLFASRQYLKRHGEPREPAELEGHECLQAAMGLAEKGWELKRGKQKLLVRLPKSTGANTVGLLAQFAREHLGIVVLPKFLAAHPTFGAGLVRVLPEWEATPAHIFALTANRIVPARVGSLLESAKASFNGRITELERG